MRKIIFIFLIAGLTGCFPGKKTTQVTENTTATDSTWVRKYDSLASVSAREKKLLVEENVRLQRVVANFKPSPACPDPIIIDNTTGQDSLVARIKQLAAYAASLKNEVQINKDGSIRLTGQLQNVSADLLNHVKALQDVANEYNKVVVERDSSSFWASHYKSEVDRLSKRKTGFPWLWLLLAFAGGVAATIIYKIRFS